jgi:hypothetical protein
VKEKTTLDVVPRTVPAANIPQLGCKLEEFSAMAFFLASETVALSRSA